MSELLNGIKAAKRCGTPIVSVSSPDQMATMYTLGSIDCPRFVWDVAAGMRGLNEEARQWADANLPAMDPYVNAPDDMLKKCLELPAASMVYMINAQRYWNDPVVLQCISNLRDNFKRDRRMLILLGPDMHDIPLELATTVIGFDEPLPSDVDLEQIVCEQVEASASSMDVEVGHKAIKEAVASLRGTSTFQAEQLTAMALRKSGIDLESLRYQSKSLIEETPGLSIDGQTLTFDDIGGLDWAKKFGTMLFNGPAPPRVVVRIEELDKVMGGAKTDQSGTSQDALQVILSSMEDNNWSGMLAFGAPGAGKSFYSKTLATHHGALPMQLDLNATKGSLVGQSEAQVRRAMKVVKTIGGSDVFFIASVNALDSIPPELQRRFRCGVWFFDVPTPAERVRIWEINRAVFGIEDQDLPADENFTGADIRNICEMSYKLGCTLKEALKFIVPLKVQSPDAIEQAQRAASGKFLSANVEGVYRRPEKAKGKAEAKSQKRSVELI